MKIRIPDKSAIVKIFIAFFAPLAISILLFQTRLIEVKIDSHLLHALIMVVSGTISFYIFYRAYRIYKSNKSPILLSLSIAFLIFGISLVFHAVSIPGLTYLFNETFFDITEHYGLFLGSLILLGIIFPYNKKIEDFFYKYHKIFLYSVLLIFLIFFVFALAMPSWADFLEMYVNLPIGITSIAFFLNAIFVFGAHDFKRKRNPLSLYLMSGLFVLANAGIIPFFYEEWNVLWWFFHFIFIVGYLLILIGLLKTKENISEFGEIFAHIPISARIIMNYFTLGAIGIFTLGFLSYYSAERSILNQIFNDLALTSRVERENILNFFEYSKGRVIDFSSDGFIRDSVDMMIKNDKTTEVADQLNPHLIANKMSLDPSIIGINILDLDGKVIVSTNSEDIGKDESDDDYFLQAKNLAYGNAYMSDIRMSQHFQGKEAFFTASTILTEKETYKPIGVIVNYYNAEVLDKVVNGYQGGRVTEAFLSGEYSKKTMEIFIANSDGLMITESKFLDNAVLRQKVYTDPYWLCKNEKKSTQGIYDDYRAVKVVGASECLPNGWLLITKIDAQEALSPLTSIQKESLVFGIIVLSFIVLIAFYLSKAITLPLQKLEQAAMKVSSGDLSAQAEIISQDEIGGLAQIFNGMINQLRQLYEGLEQKVKERTQELAERVDEIGREKEKISTILFGIGDGVFVIDNDFKIILWNKAAENISGFSAKEVMGKKYDSALKFINEKTGDSAGDFIKKTIEIGEAQEMPSYTLLVQKDNSQVAVADSSAPLKDKNGNTVGCVVVFRDSTKEREIDRAKTEFVSLASHQLRTPLSAIKWYAEMMLAGDAGNLNKTQSEYMNAIDQSNARMIDLINSLLNVSRIDMGTFAIEPKPTNLIEISESVVSELVMQIKEKKINFSAKYEKDIPLIQADAKLVRIIIQNLLSNAVKYTSNGGNVGIEMNKDGENIMIKVSDSGYGIPKDAQSKIFTKLFRADNVRVKEVDGTGLGLYVVKSILDESGGKIWFESEENKGATFFVAIPLSGMKKKEGNRELS